MPAHDPGTKLNGLQLADHASDRPETSMKKSRNGVILVPQPSDDPRDPLVCLTHFGYGILEFLTVSSNLMHRAELASVEKTCPRWYIEPRRIRWD